MPMAAAAARMGRFSCSVVRVAAFPLFRILKVIPADCSSSVKKS